ncbi:MAG: D-alanine--D-alanine ligase [Bdellovibrionales bacterium]|nr:D-alanine--D-alanine ligase [Bdellovibrionales bacterium]
MKKIALIQGGLGPENKISLMSAKAVAQAFDKLNYPYIKLEADQKLPQNLISQKPSLAFLAVHGLYGEDGLIQSLCEFLKIPYTGSGVLASSLSMNKIFAKQLFIKNKIPTPDFQIVDSFWSPKKISSYPVVIKSSHGGSSLGVYIAKNEKELLSAIQKAKKLGTQVFIENYLEKSKELAVSFFKGNILTPVEITPKASFYDYKRKYEQGESVYSIPPSIDPFVVEKIKSLSKYIFQIVGVRSYARADFLIQKNKTPWLLEVNTLPGLTKHSLLPKSANYDGISFIKLIEHITLLATTDYQI